MSVAGEILAVLRLAFTLRLDARRLVGRDATIALLGAAALGVWILCGRLRGNAPLSLAPGTALPGIAACAVAALALAWLVARLSNPPLPIRQTLWLVAGYLPAAVAIAWLLRAPIPRSLFVAVATFAAIHSSLYSYFGLRALAATRPRRAFTAWLAGVAALVVIGQLVPVNAGLWVPHQTAAQLSAFAETQRRAESLLYAQPERIEAALSTVTRGSAPGSQVFFVGFAGYGEQRVFAQEIALAARRVADRYGTGSRSVLLINDSRDLDGHPLASSSGLERVLKGVAARMDPERDVLFLALSSHGKRSPYLVVTNGALPLGQITPASLAHMLRESGIRWKVLVVSACYGGAFIAGLRDDFTAVITAAAPDRTSFGCNDRRELTYFGEAFYRDALPRAASLREAFDAASADIAARERREGLQPSNPRAWFGASLERELAQLEVSRTMLVSGEDQAGPLGEAASQASASDRTHAPPRGLR